MRHQKHGRKFGRQSGPRHALFSNMVSSLIEHERIETTDAKAKELRPLVEKAITWATSVGNLVGDGKKRDADDQARIVHAMRMAQRVVKHKPSLDKLFNDLGPRFLGRAGGYTRIMKTRNRHGDAAPMSIIELVVRSEVEEQPEAAEPEAKEAKPSKKKAAPKAEAASAEAAPKKRAAKPAAKKEAGEKPAAKAKAKKSEDKGE
jgi:large subunit ribosomal protein L17